MPRRIRLCPLYHLRRFLTIHQWTIWELMAPMAYACPVAPFPHPELFAQDDPDAHPDHAIPEVGAIPEVRLTEAECRTWDELCQELSSGQGGHGRNGR